MNSFLKGFAGELLKLAHPDPVFVDTSPIPYEPNIIPGDISTLGPPKPASKQFLSGFLGRIETPKETIDEHKFNHWYRTKP